MSHGRNKLGVAIAKYFEPVRGHDGGVSEELKLLLSCLAPSTSQWKKVTRVLKDQSIYKAYQDCLEDEALK